MINKVILVGHMVRDSELRVTNSGQSVATFTIAVNRPFNSNNGQEADFINCVCWGKLGENVNEYTEKGSHIAVEGRLQSRSYDNAQGQKVYVVEVVCNSVEFLNNKTKEEKNGEEQNNLYDVKNVDLEKNFDNSFDIMEDDIQF